MQKQNLETLLRTIPRGFWVVDSKKNIIDVNDAFCRMTGYARKDILKMTINDIDSVENPKVTDARIERILKNGSETFESSHRCKNGDIIQVETSVFFLNINNGRLICLSKEITAPIADQYPPNEPENMNFSSENKLHILLAEDKIIQQKVINLLLTSLGHTVTIAQNGKHALELYQPGKFDLILMDIQMPVMDGVTATQKLKEKYDDLPPIAGLSAINFKGDRENYMEMGMDEFLRKPVRKDDFRRLISKILARPEFSFGRTLMLNQKRLVSHN